MIQADEDQENQRPTMGHEADLSKGSCDPASTEDPGAQRTPGYVIRTDVLKRSSRAFINVCGNEGIGRPFYRDLKNLWTVPHGLAGPKEDPAGKRPDKCRVYDFVVNPSTLRMVEASDSFRKAVNDLAVEGVSKQFNVRLDKKHLAFPDMTYKGAVTNVSFVEKLAQVSVENCGNELNEFFSNESCKDMICFEEETDNSYTTCLRDGKSSKMTDNEIEAGELDKSLMNGCFSDEKFIEYTEENSGPDVNLKNMSSAERILENSVDVSDAVLKAMEDNDNLSYTKVEDSGYVLPAYESFQDKVSVTFIFDVRKVNGKDASLIVRSSQEILLRMVTSVENESPLLHYQCCLKFGNKCRFVEDGCRLDVSETNVVLTIAKAEKSKVTWHAYFIGTSFQHLDVRDFASVDGLKRHLDALDMVSASPPGNVCEDEKITKDTKAEEKELEDVVPGEIVVIHERRTPKLHGILKQRSMSESSDDLLSPWSYSLDRLVGAATCSDTESEGFEDGPVRFRPCFKKSVSFSEQIDEAMFVVNQSVSQMHQALKNKRRRMRKREQKHELKEARRRCRSSSESCSTQDDQDFVSELLSAEKHRAFLYSEKAAWNLTRNAVGGTSSGEFHDDSGSESAVHTDEDCTDKKTDVDIEENAFNEDVVEDGSCRTDVDEVCENLNGTRESILELIPEKTSLETCGRTSNGGTPGLVGGAKQGANLDDVVGDTNVGMLSYKIDPGTSHDDESIASQYNESRGSLENKVEFSQRKSAFVVDGDQSAFKLCDDKPVSSVESNGLKNNGDGFVVNDHPLTSTVNQ